MKIRHGLDLLASNREMIDAGLDPVRHARPLQYRASMTLEERPDDIIQEAAELEPLNG